MTQQESIDYNTDLEQLLKLHAEECESLSILHRNAYEKYNGRSNYINIPVIILSSAIGFATGIDIGYDKMNIILGLGSIFVGIIKSIDTYFQLGKRAESHRLCSLQFQQINKKIQIELALVRSQRVDAKDMMNIIKTDIKNLFDIAPLIDQDVIESFQKKYGKQVANEPGKYTFDAHTPNLCNGLSIVTVNSARNKQDYEERTSRKSSRDGSPARDNDNNGGGGGGGSGGGGSGGGGVTVVIDNASIAKEIQEQRMQQYQHQQQKQQQEQPLQPHNQFQMNMLTQQLQQLQLQQLQMQHQQQPHPVIIENIPEFNHVINSNSFRASADLVRTSTKPVSPPTSAPRSVARSVSRTPVPLQSTSASARQSAAPSIAPSIHPSAAPSIAPSAHQSAAPSAHQSAAPSAHQSAAPSAHPSAAPSIAPSAHPSAAPSAHQSMHGDSTPVTLELHEYVQQPMDIALQLTQDQLRQLLQQQEQMMKDLDGQDGEMM
jgi:uncharacterized membrane protein YgcG